MRDREALATVFRDRYEEIRDCAIAAARRERPGHTLQATAIVHEAFLRLARSDGIDVEDPIAFRALIAAVVRHVLVDYARSRNGPRRNPGAPRVDIDATELEVHASAAVDLIDLDAALERLREIHPRQAEVVEGRLFGGLTHEESARRLGVSTATVELDWKLARHWLQARLGETSGLGTSR